MTVDGLTTEEVESTIQSALADKLNMHPSDIVVSYDMDSGGVTYTISTDNAESLKGVASVMNEDGFEDGLIVSDVIEVDEFTAPSDIVAVIDVIVDASDVADVDSAVSSVTNAIEGQDASYDVSGEGNFLNVFGGRVNFH